MKLYPHQKHVVKFMETNRGVLCLHSTGTGKSITSIATADRLMELGLITHVVALVKKSIIDQYSQVVESVNPKLVDAFQVTTVETFLRNDLPPASKTFLIVDEAHAFHNSKGVVTQKLHDYAAQCKRVMLLTATPFSNDLNDLAPLLCMIKGDPLLSRKEFEHILGTGIHSSTFQSWASNCVSVYVIDKNKTEGYPKLTEKVVSVQMNPATEKEVRRRLATSTAPFFVEERQLSFGVGSCEKCTWLTAEMKKWFAAGQDRVVIYVGFIERGVEPLMELLKQNKINAILIDGDTPLGIRKKTLTVFNRMKPTSMKGGTRKANICGKNEWYTRVTTRRNPDAFKYYKHFDMATMKPSKEFTPTEDELDASRHPPIPPLWSPAVVCSRKNKVVWGALDTKKRWQRKYSEEWEFTREEAKMRLVSKMDQTFWDRFEKVVDAKIREKTWSLDKLHALVAKLMSLCHFRVGGAVDEDDAHYGTTTLLKRHAKMVNGALNFSFVGKSGVENNCVVRDKLFVSEMAELLKGQGQLFATGKHAVTPTSFRNFLKENKLEVRPKEFRTYHANHRMMEELVKVDPSSMKVNARKKVVKEAFKVVSEDLNNTPAVVKSSYVFNAMWVYFLASPYEFKTTTAGNASTATKLNKLIALFFEELDWRKMLQEYKDTFGLKTFLNTDITTLVITDAGAESLDLKGVRNLVLMDGVWNKAAEDQIIGRGQRFNSHAHLPLKKRNMTAWKLILDFPKGGKSPERLMHETVEAKNKEALDLYAVLKKISI